MPVLQSCLFDQKFVLNDSVTVQQLLKAKGQQCGLPGEFVCEPWVGLGASAIGMLAVGVLHSKCLHLLLQLRYIDADTRQAWGKPGACYARDKVITTLC